MPYTKRRGRPKNSRKVEKPKAAKRVIWSDDFCLFLFDELKKIGFEKYQENRRAFHKSIAESLFDSPHYAEKISTKIQWTLSKTAALFKRKKRTKNIKPEEAQYEKWIPLFFPKEFETELKKSTHLSPDSDREEVPKITDNTAPLQQPDQLEDEMNESHAPETVLPFPTSFADHYSGTHLTDFYNVNPQIAPTTEHRRLPVVVPNSEASTREQSDAESVTTEFLLGSSLSPLISESPESSFLNYATVETKTSSPVTASCSFLEKNIASNDSYQHPFLEIDDHSLPDQHPSPEIANRSLPDRHPSPEIANRSLPDRHPSPEIANRSLPDQHPSPEIANHSLVSQHPSQETVNSSLINQHPSPETVNNSLVNQHPSPETVNHALVSQHPFQETVNRVLVNQHPSPETVNNSLVSQHPSPETVNHLVASEHPSPDIYHHTIADQHPSSDIAYHTSVNFDHQLASNKQLAIPSSSDSSVNSRHHCCCKSMDNSLNRFSPVNSTERYSCPIQKQGLSLISTYFMTENTPEEQRLQYAQMEFQLKKMDHDQRMQILKLEEMRLDIERENIRIRSNLT